jgi:hypothetical protein
MFRDEKVERERERANELTILYHCVDRQPETNHVAFHMQPTCRPDHGP